MSGWRRYVATAVVIYLLALLWQLPASRAYGWLAPHLETRSPRIALMGLSGALIDGRAEQLQINGRPLGALRWQLSPLNLLIGELAADWQLDSPAGLLEGGVSGDGETVVVAPLDGRLDIAAVAKRLGGVPVALEGELSLRLERLTLTAGSVVAEGEAVWHGAAIEWVERLPLGDLTLLFAQTEGGATQITLADNGGPLQIAGTVTVTPDRYYRTDLRLAPRRDARPGLIEALSLIGRPEGDGYRVNQNGRL